MSTKEVLRQFFFFFELFLSGKSRKQKCFQNFSLTHSTQAFRSHRSRSSGSLHFSQHHGSAARSGSADNGTVRNQSRTKNQCHKHAISLPIQCDADDDDPDHPSMESLRKGDVYAFGVILFEIAGLRGPWGKREMTGRDVDGEKQMYYIYLFALVGNLRQRKQVSWKCFCPVSSCRSVAQCLLSHLHLNEVCLSVLPPPAAGGDRRRR